MTDIAVSSCCFPHRDLPAIIAVCVRHGIDCLELSGNLAPIPERELYGQLKKLEALGRFYMHNYFPAPREPILLNLGHPATRESTMAFIRRALDICHDFGLPIYSFHAGFTFNLALNSLNNRQNAYPSLPPAESRRLLVESLAELCEYARGRGVALAVENNIVADYNRPPNGQTRYHLSEPEETREVLAGLEGLGLHVLMDFAHLKVSAQTLGYSRESYLELLWPMVLAAHISENDGLADLNQPVEESSWFWPHLAGKELQYISLETVPLEPEALASQVELIRRMAPPGAGTSRAGQVGGR